MKQYQHFYPKSDINLKNFTQKILMYISQNLTIKQMIQRTGKSKSTVYRHINILEQYNFIVIDRTSSPYLLFINLSKQKQLSHFLGVSEKMGHENDMTTKNASFSKPSDKTKESSIVIRSHNFTYHLPIQRKPLALKQMLSHTTWLEVVRMNRWDYYSGTLVLSPPKFSGKFDLPQIEAIVQFKPNVVQIYLNEIYGYTSEENLNYANQLLLKVRAQLESLYPGLCLAPAQLKRRVENSGQHHAWVHHTLALKCKQRNISLKNKTWEVDASHGQPELEATHKLESDLHLMNELDDFDYRAEHGVYFKDLYNDINETKANQRRATKTITSAQQHTTKVLSELQRTTKDVAQEQQRAAKTIALEQQRTSKVIASAVSANTTGLMTNTQIITNLTVKYSELYDMYRQDRELIRDLKKRIKTRESKIDVNASHSKRNKIEETINQLKKIIKKT